MAFHHGMVVVQKPSKKQHISRYACEVAWHPLMWTLFHSCMNEISASTRMHILAEVVVSQASAAVKKGCLLYTT
eukprot:40609-Eustigmatos_ZCMA.PRE.1